MTLEYDVSNLANRALFRRHSRCFIIIPIPSIRRRRL